jgi:hypothetical protein
MEIEHFEKLCSVMKKYEVTSYKCSGVEIEMAKKIEIPAYAFNPNDKDKLITDEDILENPYVGLEA